MENQKFSRTQTSLLTVHMLYIVLELFTSTFLTSHIVSVDPNDVLGSGLFNIGLFYISQFTVYSILYFVNSHFADKSNRVSFLIVGILVNTVLLIALVFWGEIISNWIVLAGALIGLADSFYYSSYIVMKNELNGRRYIKKYNMLTTVITNIIKVIVPTILGFVIDASSYSSIAIYVILITVVQFVISFFIKSFKPQGSKFEIGAYFKFLKENKDVRNKVKYTYFNAALVGPKSTFKIIVIILTIYTFKTNVSLGIFTSLFSFATMALLLLYKKIDDNPKINKLAIYLLIGILPVLCCVFMVIWLNKATLIIYNFVLTITIYFSDYFGSLERDAIIKNIGRKEFIAEHQLVVETTQDISRIIAYGLFVVAGAFGSINVFKILLLILIATTPLKYVVMYKQRQVRKGFEIANKSTETLNEKQA